jgi:hypothetical protein
MRALKAQTNLHSTQFQRKKADYAHVTEMPV